MSKVDERMTSRSKGNAKSFFSLGMNKREVDNSFRRNRKDAIARKRTGFGEG